MLKWEYCITFVCNAVPDYIASEIAIDGFKLFQIENESEFFQIILNCDIIVLDGYNFDLSYQEIIKKLSYKLVCIDDIHEQKFIADLIINHAPGVSELDYKATISTRFALGLDYALLRPVFLNQALILREIKQVNTVLICFGGADEINLTQRIVSDVLQMNKFKEIIVITGTAYRHFKKLKEVINGSKIISHIHQANESEMLSSMLKADLAIVPSSGILVEVLAVGCIALSGYYINNQMNIYNGFKKLDAIIDAGDFRNCNISNILVNTSNLKKKHIIDGQSGTRIVEKLKLLENENTDISR
jgi:UDP-2,4-diacetamido-2,4,6-trideoxy-beta-L-altropyranose hydrolase